MSLSKTRRFPTLLAFALVATALRGAWAGDPPKPPAGAKPADAPAPEPDYKGPEVRWATSLADAAEEALQRNVALYVHSHGST